MVASAKLLDDVYGTEKKMIMPGSANYNELSEVIQLAKEGKLKHHIQKFTLNEINKAMSLLKDGKIIGRAVITPN